MPIGLEVDTDVVSLSGVMQVFDTCRDAGDRETLCKNSSQ